MNLVKLVKVVKVVIPAGTSWTIISWDSLLSVVPTPSRLAAW